MVIKKIIYYFFTFLIFLSLQAMLTEEQLEIVKKYPAPREIQIKLDAHSKEVKKNNKPREYAWLPGYYVKTDLSRIVGAQLFQKEIFEKKYKTIFVPAKFFHNNRVISQKVVGTEGGNLTLEQVKELVDLFFSKKYTDGHSGNLIQTNDGKVAVIDSELKSFGKESYDKIYSLHALRCNSFDHENTYRYLLTQIALKEKEYYK